MKPLQRIVDARRAVTADTALRLARAPGTADRFWLGLQAGHDREKTRRSPGNELEKTRSSHKSRPLVRFRVLIQRMKCLPV
jgi:plasmid maintenance system antidote protein VapI